MERKLASVQQIVRITPHLNADTLEIATILGWRCVVKKGQFKEGDLCVYFEIDSILPELPEFEFMKSSSYRLRTLRLRGQLSQGLCWPIEILPEELRQEGLDVTEFLKILKYEEVTPPDMIGKSKGPHPTTVSKPGETRVQSFPGLIQEFWDLLVAITTKIDGLASSYIHDWSGYHVCCHTHDLIEDASNVYWQMAYKYHILDILKEVGYFSIQGEIAGPGIAGNKLGLMEKQLFVFKVFNNDTQQYLLPGELIAFCNQYGLQHVPMELDIKFEFTMDQLLELAKGTYPNGHQREGIVIVPMQPKYSEILCAPLSMKVINNDYL